MLWGDDTYEQGKDYNSHLSSHVPYYASIQDRKIPERQSWWNSSQRMPQGYTSWNCPWN